MLTAFAISMLPVCAIYTVGKMEGNNLWEVSCFEVVH